MPTLACTLVHVVHTQSIDLCVVRCERVALQVGEALLRSPDFRNLLAEQRFARVRQRFQVFNDQPDVFVGDFLSGNLGIRPSPSRTIARTSSMSRSIGTRRGAWSPAPRGPWHARHTLS